MLHFEGLRKKIIKHYITIIMLTTALFEVLFIFYIQNYYYASVQNSLKSEVVYTKVIYDNLLESNNKSFEDIVKNILEKQNMSKSSMFSIEVIDNENRLILDQYGFRTNEIVTDIDVMNALKDSKELNPYTYKIEETNEHVMSISVPIKSNNTIEGVVRYTTSLDAIDKTILKLAIGLIVSGLLILIIVISISIRFADTLIKPLNELREFANQLADGNYKIKLKSNNISDDEIGDLAQTFEHMASEIDKSERLKDEFISSISHELRTPLTSIKGWSETLGYDGITKYETELGLSIIQDETERLIKLVEELLDFSRLSSDRIKLQIDNVDIKLLCQGVINQLKIKASEKNIILSMDVDAKSDIIAQGDKNRLRQVLINLIQNALKFTPENGYVKIDLYKDDNYIYIKVIDNGIGIESENLEKVLDKFFQEDHNKAGSGLGLAISSEIVKLHGGKMTIDSEKNKGTTISFNIKNKLID